MKEIIIPYPPTPLQSIIFHGEYPVSLRKEGDLKFFLKPTTSVIGPQFSRWNLLLNNKLKAVRVDFQACGLYRLLGIPMRNLFDEVYDGFDIFGREVKCINDKIGEETDIEKSKIIVENFLLKKITILKKQLPFDFAIRKLIYDNGNTSIDKIASFACLSKRQFERKCLERIGMPPKIFARIVRFSKAYRLKEFNPKISWTDIAHNVGYFDQTHLIRDFKEFAGVTPHIIEEAISKTPIHMQADLLT